MPPRKWFIFAGRSEISHRNLAFCSSRNSCQNCNVIALRLSSMLLPGSRRRHFAAISVHIGSRLPSNYLPSFFIDFVACTKAMHEMQFCCMMQRCWLAWGVENFNFSIALFVRRCIIQGHLDISPPILMSKDTFRTNYVFTSKAWIASFASNPLFLMRRHKGRKRALHS